MIERLARAMRRTLEHHGVVLHPDDVRGLAIDALTELLTPDEVMVEAGCENVVGCCSPNPESATEIFQSMILSGRDR